LRGKITRMAGKDRSLAPQGADSKESSAADKQGQAVACSKKQLCFHKARNVEPLNKARNYSPSQCRSSKVRKSICPIYIESSQSGNRKQFGRRCFSSMRAPRPSIRSQVASSGRTVLKSTDRLAGLYSYTIPPRHEICPAPFCRYPLAYPDRSL
jgi:hypothetical protein